MALSGSPSGIARGCEPNVVNKMHAGVLSRGGTYGTGGGRLAMEWNLCVAACLLVLGLCLLVHHGFVHYFEDPACSHAQRESCCVACYFQPKDIAHCETWAAICLSNALCFGCLAPALAGVAVDWGMHQLVGVVLCVLGVIFLIQALHDSFCPQNVRNHETWVLVCLTNAVSMALVFS